MDRKNIHLILVSLWVIIFLRFVFHSEAMSSYVFVVKEVSYTRLCATKSILTVNGKFPGPTIYAYKGDTIKVKVINNGRHNITLHWHGVRQPRNPWSDGPEYVTQCPIKPGGSFIQTVIFSEEEGTIWWHAHSDWARATVYGPIIVYPKPGCSYPFPKPDSEIPIMLGEWWRRDIFDVYYEFQRTGGEPNVSDAFTINGQPGDLYPCSSAETFKMFVCHGERLLLRMINADMNQPLFVSIANHPLTVVATDASYTKPLTRDYIVLAPGQTMDCLVHANQQPGRYYLAARAYASGVNVSFDNTTTTAILHYKDNSYDQLSTPLLPSLPYYNNTNASFSFTSSLRSLDNNDHPSKVPQKVDHHIFTPISMNLVPCPNNACEGPNGSRFAASMTNNSFVLPDIDILEAYYFHIKGVYKKRFPSHPHVVFNYTAEYQDLRYLMPKFDTLVKVFRYNTNVEVIFQDTTLVAGLDHPMHLHGQSFWVVGLGIGNFNKRRDRRKFNLVDPPKQNTVLVPKNGWAAIRFQASNPGVWYLHCHFERHLTWGMMTTFIVRDGEDEMSQLLPPPPDMPPC